MIFRDSSLPADQVHSLLLLIRLKLFLCEEVITRLVRIHKDPQIGVTGDHSHCLGDFIRIHSQVFPGLVNVASQLLQVVLYEVDLALVTLLNRI